MTIPFPHCSNETLNLIMQGKNINSFNSLELENNSNNHFYKDVNGINLSETNDSLNSCFYYTLSELNNIKTNKQNLSIFHWFTL